MTETASTLMPTRLTGISPKAYEHPADRAATAALRSIPFLDQVIKKLIEFNYERALKQFYLANSIKVGPRQLPRVWDLYTDTLATLDMPDTYDLYVMQTPHVNAFTLGAEKPIIVLQSGLVTLLDDDELKGVIAHEVGHIHSEHVLYRTALLILLQLSLLGLPTVAGLPIAMIRLALLEWYRASELTCDRAAVLVLRDPLIYCRAMMKLAGGGLNNQLNLDAFLAQANDYEDWEDSTDKGLRFFLEINATHPFPVRRVSEISKWVASGEFDAIMAGNYIRRGQEPTPDAEFTKAVNHYRNEMINLLEEAGTGVNQFGQRLRDWLNQADNN
jgi:Zn-dependent protease with chaperone function